MNFDLLEKVKRQKYRRWYLFAVANSHALESMHERGVNMRDVRVILKKGELIGNFDPKIINCVGKKNSKFFTLVLRPFVKYKAFGLDTVRPSSRHEIKLFKKLKRNKRVGRKG